MSQPSRDSRSTTDTSSPHSPALVPGTGSSAPLGVVHVHFDPTPPLAQDVLQLFRGAFAEVRFPDMDRDRLEADVHVLLVCQAEVEALERELERARMDTREAAAVLNASAGRALAYASIFASGQADLEQALRAVRSGQSDASSDRGPKKRRGRPPGSAGEQLPIEASASAVHDDAAGEDLPAMPHRAESDDVEGHESSHDQAAE